MTQKEMRSLSGRFQTSPHKQRSVRDNSLHREISAEQEESTQKLTEGKDKVDGVLHYGDDSNFGDKHNSMIV